MRPDISIRINRQIFENPRKKADGGIFQIIGRHMHCRLRQQEHLAHMVLCIMDTTFSIECQMFQAVYLLRFIGRRNFIHLTVHLELSSAFN